MCSGVVLVFILVMSLCLKPEFHVEYKQIFHQNPGANGKEMKAEKIREYPRDSIKDIMRNKNVENNEEVNFINDFQVSISPTIYMRLFCTKVLRKAFLKLHFRFELFGCNNIGPNALIKSW
jgi:hypothetical protein